MVCNGPDPPDHTPHELKPPNIQDLTENVETGEDSDEENVDYMGYEPLPQGPDSVVLEHGNTSCGENEENSETSAVPPIEPMDQTLSKQVWSTTRETDTIKMDTQKAQEVMSAMANFVLPSTSIPEWARLVNEDQWKETLKERISKLKQPSVQKRPKLEIASMKIMRCKHHSMK